MKDSDMTETKTKYLLIAWDENNYEIFNSKEEVKEHFLNLVETNDMSWDDEVTTSDLEIQILQLNQGPTVKEIYLKRVIERKVVDDKPTNAIDSAIKKT